MECIYFVVASWLIIVLKVITETVWSRSSRCIEIRVNEQTDVSYVLVPFAAQCSITKYRFKSLESVR